MQKKKLYILVSNELPPVYGCVQGGHAVAQWLLEHPEQDWNNKYLIYLYVDIKRWLRRLRYCGIDYSLFKEPDLGGKVTAIAVRDDNGQMFRKLHLVR